MMRTMTTLAATLVLAACTSEQEIIPDPEEVVAINPPEPENPVQQDRILQASRPKVDVLFVIDNSCSMLEEQAQLAANFPQFMEYFLGSGLDYHIGVVSTDMDFGTDSGKLQTAQGYRFIDENTVDPTTVFSQMASMGTTGWWEERGRDAVYTAIELIGDSPTNEGFYRGSAALNVVFVSDENDTSTLISRTEFREWMRNLKWADEMIAAHAIVGDDLGFGDTCDDAYEAGADYLNLASDLNGISFSICESDWGPMLDQLGLEASGMKREYFLSRLPVFSTLEVLLVVPSPQGPVERAHEVCLSGTEVDNEECEVAYNAQRNSIVFLDFLPDPSSEIIMRYNIRENFAADGVTGDDNPGGSQPPGGE